MTNQSMDTFAPGMQVRVIQQIPSTSEPRTNELVGTVVRYSQQKTGSWFANAKDDKLWLDRLVLRLADGEIVDLILDGYTHIELLDGSGLCEST